MYSKNEAILDFKKKTQNDGGKKSKKLNQVIFFFFQKVETDQPASRLRIQTV